MREVLDKASSCVENTIQFLASNTARQSLEMCVKHGKCPEPGPYGSVWADNCSQSLPRALGSLWDASQTPKPPKNQKIPGLRGLGGQAPYSPYWPLRAVAKVS